MEILVLSVAGSVSRFWEWGCFCSCVLFLPRDLAIKNGPRIKKRRTEDSTDKKKQYVFSV